MLALIPFVLLIASATSSNSTCIDAFTQCNQHGYCVNDECECFEHYSSFNCRPDTYCCYKQKSKATAICLQLFLNSGTWYLGMEDISIVSLTAFCTAIISLIMYICFSISQGDKYGEQISEIAGGLAALCALTVIVCWFVGFIMVCMADVDQNHVPLY
jgi:hypothetical protein